MNLTHMDAIIDQHVFGFSAPGYDFHYTTDIKDAWRLVEHIKGVWDIRSMPNSWQVRLAVQQGPYSDKIVTVEASTAPLAICLASLRALGIYYAAS